MKIRSMLASGVLACFLTLSAVAVTGPLAGCSLLGIPVAKSFNERVALAYSGVTAVRETALAALQARQITKGDAQNVQDQADNARAGIEVAIQLKASNPEAAENRLDAARVIVDALRAYLKSRGKS